MSEVAIRAVGLSKLYHLDKSCGIRGLQQSFVGSLSAPIRTIKSWLGHGIVEKAFEFDANLWALKDVSFDIKRGEVVGIIGPNGAGKSTLLKILSRITDPTEGHVEIQGRVRSLLEVGTGFHPDLTGRENIYLNGAILGLKKAEISRKFDEIVDFSEVDRFLDTPVKYYSSGMYMRLAFSVAAHLEPDILLVDEVLAVGDAAFQKKSLGKMRHVAREGRTVLFVSHNLQAISVLTNRGLLFSGGRCVSDGPISSVLAQYLHEEMRPDTIYSDGPSRFAPRITRVEVRTSKPGNTQVNDESIEIMFEVTTPEPIDGAALSFQVFNSLQQPILHLWTFDSERPMCRETGVFRLVCRIPRLHLYMGDYTLTVHLSERAGGKKYQTIEGICPFKVVMYGKARSSSGSLTPVPTWRIATGKSRKLPRYENFEPLNCFNPMDENMNAIPSELLQLEAYSVSGRLTLEKLYRLGQDVVARDVGGDFVECGVYNGGSAAAMACAFRSSNHRLWLYDSFQGMSATQAVDGELASRYVGELVGDEARVRKALEVASFPESRCVIRKGWFVDTLQLPLPKKVALLHVDADWYDNVTLILETFYDRVSDGGVIILDDFGHWEGCREAFYDFVRGRGLKPLLERSGHTQAFWIKGRGHNRDFSGKTAIP